MLMIKTVFRYVALFVAVVTIALWISLQTDAAQRWAKESITKALYDELALEVSIGSVSGLAPFYLSVQDIQCKKPSLHVATFTVLPNWFGFLIGRASFFYIGMHDVDLREISLQSNKSSTSTQIPIHIWAFRISHLTLPQKYNTPFLNTRTDEIESGLYFDLFAKLHYEPKDSSIDGSVSITPRAGSSSIGTFEADLHMDKELTEIQNSIEARQTKPASVFIRLPCDTINFSSTLKGKTVEILDAVKNSHTPCFSGSWKLSAIKKKDSVLVSPYLRFDIKGSIDIPKAGPLAFDTTEMSCHELLPHTRKNEKEKASIVQIPMSGKICAKIDTNDPNQLSLKLNSSQFCFDDTAIEPLDLAFCCSASQTGWHGSLSLDASVRHSEKPTLFLNGRANWKSDMISSLSLTEISGSVAKFAFLGNLDMLFYPFQINGRLESPVSDIASFFEVLGQKAKGKARMLCLFSADPKTLTQTIDLNVDLANLRSSNYALGSANLVLQSRGLLPTPVLDIHANVGNFLTKHGELERCIADSTIHLDSGLASPFALQAQGKSFTGPYALSFKGVLTKDKTSILAFEMLSNGQKLHIKEPITISSSQINPFALYLDERSVCNASFEKTDSTVSSTVQLSDFPIQFFGPFLPRPLYGSLSGQLGINGIVTKPQVFVNVATSNLTFWPPHEALFEPQSLSIDIEHTDNLCTIKTGLQNLKFLINTPLTFSFKPFTCTFEEDRQISGFLKGDFNVASVFGSNDEDLAGNLLFDIDLSGYIKKPLFSGKMVIEQGKLHLPILSSPLNDIQALITFDKNQAAIESFSCTDDQNGTLCAKGYANLTSFNSCSYSISAELKDYEIVKRDDASVISSGTIDVTGTSSEATISGSLPVMQANLLLSQQSQNVPKIEISYVNLPEKQVSIIPTPFIFHVDLHIDLPQNGFLHGLGLDSEWQGKIHLSGQNRDIELNGDMSCLHGTFSFADKVFKIQKGKVDFRGAFEKSHLFVVATHEVSDIIAQIILKGPIDSPKITLQSTPHLKEKEILSWILFNKSASEISPLQGLQLAQQLLRLQNGGNTDIIDKIKESLGLDRLDFGTKSHVGPLSGLQYGENAHALQEQIPNEVSFQVGKYISEGVMVTLSKDVTNEVNRIGIEAQLAKHITAEANVGDDAETQISLKWKKRY